MPCRALNCMSPCLPLPPYRVALTLKLFDVNHVFVSTSLFTRYHVRTCLRF